MSLKKEVFVFTGTLSSMTRKQAQAVVSSLKGKHKSTVTQETTLLIIGNQQIDLLNDNQQSKKIIEANRLKSEGKEIQFLNEKEFIRLVTQQFQLLLSHL